MAQHCQAVALEQLAPPLDVVGLSQRTVDLEVVAPAAGLQAVVAPGRDARGDIVERQIGPLTGEQSDRPGHGASLIASVSIMRAPAPGDRAGRLVVRRAPGTSVAEVRWTSETRRIRLAGLATFGSGAGVMGPAPSVRPALSMPYVAGRPDRSPPATTGRRRSATSCEFAGPVAAIVWFPAGVAIAFLFLGGLRFWPGLLIGDLLANDYDALPLGSATGTDAGQRARGARGRGAAAPARSARIAARQRRRPRAPGGRDRRRDGGQRHVGALSLRAGGVVSTRRAADGLAHVVAGRRDRRAGASSRSPSRGTGDCRGPVARPRDRGRRRCSRPSRASASSPSAARDRWPIWSSRPWCGRRCASAGAARRWPSPSRSSSPCGTRPTTRARSSSTRFTMSVLTAQLYITVAALSTLCLAAVVSERGRFAQSLSASRARLVKASDAERRRLEHNLHDGAQQHLSALAIRLEPRRRERARRRTRGPRPCSKRPAPS